MKLAIPCDGKTIDEQISESFGRCPYYIIIDSEIMDFKVIQNTAASAMGGAGIKAAQLIVDSGVEAVATLRCGQNAAQVLKSADIKILKTSKGTIKGIAEKYKNGELQELNDIHPGHFGK